MASLCSKHAQIKLLDPQVFTSHRVMAILGCQLDYIWNQLKVKTGGGTPVRESLFNLSKKIHF